MRTSFKTRFGTRDLDLPELVHLARSKGCRVVLFPEVEGESRGRLASRMWERGRGHANAYAIKRMVDLAERRLDQVMGAMDREDPPWTPEHLDAVRKTFAARPRDLSTLLGGRMKDSMPDPTDLKIVTQAGLLAAQGSRWILSGDAHFWGYADLLAERGLMVVKTADIPEFVDQWRAAR
jgi:hypothetical protein